MPPIPPPQDAQPVHHGGVGVSPQAQVREGPVTVGLDHPSQILDVDLVHDAGAGRDHLEPVEGVLAPLEEAVALGVAFVLQGHVQVTGVRSAEVVSDHRMIGDQFGRDDGVDPRRVAAAFGHCIPHGR